MKKVIFATTLMLSFIVLTGLTSPDSKKGDKDVIGTWEYSASDAPYEYSEGNITFTKDEDQLVGHIMIDGYRLDIEDVKYDNKKITFIVNFEGEKVFIALSFKKKTFTGVATSIQGDIDIEGNKIK